MYPLNSEGYPTKFNGEVIPIGPFHMTLKTKCDPKTGKSAQFRYDPDTGLPIDQVTGQICRIDPVSKKPINPRTKYIHHEYGLYNIGTGNPLSDQGLQTFDRFSRETGRLIDQITGLEIDDDSDLEELSYEEESESEEGIRDDDSFGEDFQIREEDGEEGDSQGEMNEEVVINRRPASNIIKPVPFSSQPKDDIPKSKSPPMKVKKLIAKTSIKPMNVVPIHPPRDINSSQASNDDQGGLKPNKEMMTFQTIIFDDDTTDEEDDDEDSDSQGSEIEESDEDDDSFGEDEDLGKKSKQDILLDVAVSWAQNPISAEQLSSDPETFIILNNILEDKNHKNSEIPIRKFKAYSFLKNLIANMPERHKPNLKHLKPRTLVKILNSKIMQIPDQGEDRLDPESSKEEVLKDVKDDLATLLAVWSTQEDKTEFLGSGTPELLIDKLKALNKLGKGELAKRGLTANLEAELGQTIHEMIKEPGFMRVARKKKDIVSILRSCLKTIREADQENPLPEQEQEQGSNSQDGNPEMLHSSEPLTYAQESMLLLSNDISQVDKQFRGGKDEQEGLLEEVSNAVNSNPQNQVLAFQGISTLKNAVKKVRFGLRLSKKSLLTDMNKGIKKVSKLHMTSKMIKKALKGLKTMKEENPNFEISEFSNKDSQILPDLRENEKIVAQELQNASKEQLNDVKWLSEKMEYLEDNYGYNPQQLNPELVEKCMEVLEGAIESEDPQAKQENELKAWNLDMPKRLVSLSLKANLRPKSKVKVLRCLNKITSTPLSRGKMAGNQVVLKKVKKSIFQIKALKKQPKEQKKAINLKPRDIKNLQTETLKILDKVTEGEEAQIEIAQDDELLELIFAERDDMDEEIGIEEEKEHQKKKDILLLNLASKLTKSPKTVKRFKIQDSPVSNYLKSMYNKQVNILPILRKTALLTGNMAHDDEARVHLREKGSVKFMKWGLDIYSKDLPLLINTTWALRRLSRKNPTNSTLILDSKILGHITNYLQQDHSSPHLSEHASHMVTNMTFRSDYNKRTLQNGFKFVEKMCMIFKYYSQLSAPKAPSVHEQAIVLASLKSLANLTVVREHSKVCSSMDIVLDMVSYLSRDKSAPAVQVMLGVLGNMAHQYDGPILKKMIEQGALGIIVDSLEYFYNANSPEMCSLALEALGQIAHTKEICSWIQKLYVVQVIINLLKNWDDDIILVVNALKCLHRIVEDEKILESAIDKNGQAVCSSVLIKYIFVIPEGQWLDSQLKIIIFRSIRLLNVMTNFDNSESMEELNRLNIGMDVCEKSKEPSLSSKTLTEIWILLRKMAFLDSMSSFICDSIAADLLSSILRSLSDKTPTLMGSELVYMLAQHTPNLGRLQAANFFLVAQKLMDFWQFDSIVATPTLLTLILFTKAGGEDFNRSLQSPAMAGLLDKIITNINQKKDPQFYEDVQNLMLTTKITTIKTERIVRKAGNADKKYEHLEIPIDTRQFLQGGQTLKLHGSDGRKRVLLIQLSKDLTYIYCKKANKRMVKQKWTVVVNQIKKIIKGYDVQDKKVGFNRKARFTMKKKPEQDHCFSIYTPNTTLKEDFHFQCRSKEDRDEWVDSINLVIRARGLQKVNKLNKRIKKVKKKPNNLDSEE